MREFVKNYNDVVIEPMIPDGLIFGGVNGIYDPVLIENGNWDPYLVEREMQIGTYFDTWNCVAESALNKLEILFKYWIEKGLLDADDIKWLTDNGYLVNGEMNFNARIIGYLAGTVVGVGNSVSKVADTIKKNGLIPESKWAFDLRDRDPLKNNATEYYKTPPQELLNLGKEFIKRFGLDWQFVWSKDANEALKRSPIQVLVNAWYRNSEGLYYNPTGNTNHAVVRKRPDNPRIFDSYDPFEKSLTDDYIYYPSGVKFTITKKIISTSMTIKNGFRYVCVEGISKQYGYAKNGKLIVGDRDEILNLWIDENDARIEGKSVSISLAMWDSIKPKYNLKMQIIEQ